jgi:hypothetical protein
LSSPDTTLVTATAWFLSIVTGCVMAPYAVVGPTSNQYVVR